VESMNWQQALILVKCQRCWHAIAKSPPVSIVQSPCHPSIKSRQR